MEQWKYSVLKSKDRHRSVIDNRRLIKGLFQPNLAFAYVYQLVVATVDF